MTWRVLFVVSTNTTPDSPGICIYNSGVALRKCQFLHNVALKESEQKGVYLIQSKLYDI